MLIRQRGAKSEEIVIHRRTQMELVKAVQALEARGYECVRKIQQITRWKWEATMIRKTSTK